jgi:hypothetical protein
MAKLYIPIGYAETVLTSPGVYEDKITEHMYYGELIRDTSSVQSTDKLNDNIDIGNQISIVADPFANANFYSMKYVEFMGAKWKITNVDVQYPRISLTVGGVYNGK